MNKTELIKLLAKNGPMTQEAARQIFELFYDTAVNELKTNGVFAIHDLVEIRVVDVAARSGTSLGQTWSKPAHKALKAKVIGAAKRMWA